MEINYFSISKNNNLKFISKREYEENNTYLAKSMLIYDDEKIGSAIEEYYKKLIPNNESENKFQIIKNQCLLYKQNYNYSNNKLIETVNKFLSKNFNSIFEFNQENTEILCIILCFVFLNLEKNYQINNLSNLKNKIDNFNFKDIDIIKMYKYIKNKNNKNNITFVYPKKLINKKIKYEIPIELIIVINKLLDIKKINLPLANTNFKKQLEILIILLNFDMIFPITFDVFIDLFDYNLKNDFNKIFSNEIIKIIKCNKNNLQLRSTNYENNINSNNIFNIPEEEISILNYYYKNYYEDNNYYSLIEKNKSFNKYYNDKDNTNNTTLNYSMLKTSCDENSSFNFIKNNESFNFFGNESYINNFYNDEITINMIIGDYIKNNNFPFETIIIFSYFISQIKNLHILTLIIPDNYSKEIEILLKNMDIFYLDFNFLTFFTSITNLNELNIEFNSLDTKLFDKFLLISFKNNLKTLRISFFNSDEYYSPCCLFKLQNNMYIKNNLYNLQSKKNIIYNDYQNNDIDYYILNNNLLKYFEINMNKFFYLLLKNKDKYHELCFFINLPTIILDNQNFINIILKFVFNIIIMNENSNLKTFKIISSNLKFNSNLTPIINDLLNQINYSKNKIENLSLKLKFYKCNLNNLINERIKILNLGDLDIYTFNNFLDLYKNKKIFSNLISIKITLNNSVINYEDNKNNINEFLKISHKNLKEKMLLTQMKVNNKNNMLELINIVYYKTNEKYILISINKLNEPYFIMAESIIRFNIKKILQTILKIINNKKYIKLNDKKIFLNIKKFLDRPKNKVIICDNIE